MLRQVLVVHDAEKQDLMRRMEIRMLRWIPMGFAEGKQAEMV